MVSLTFCFLSAVNKFLHKPPAYFDHALNLPFPRIIYKHLNSSYIENFEEIFVIGDVHGCYDELKMLLEKADVLSDSTLKIFVGDLVNKGPKNQEVLNLVRTSTSMLSVRGNHDEVVLKEYFRSKAKYQLRESNLWIKDLSPENIDYLQELPFSISIPSLNTVIVHAGMLPGKSVEQNDPHDLLTMRNIIVCDYFWEGGLQATKDISKGEPWASLWRGPEHIYFGHDAKRMLQSYPYATGLDTGCVYGNYLTGLFISGPRKGSFVNVKALKVHCKPKSFE